MNENVFVCRYHRANELNKLVNAPSLPHSIPFQNDFVSAMPLGASIGQGNTTLYLLLGTLTLVTASPTCTESFNQL